MKWTLILCAALLAGCGGMPKDPERTLERVQASRTFSVGLIAAGGPAVADRRHAFVRRVAEATGARPAIEEGAAEPLLARLERGELDLVVGAFAPKSPWARQVTLLPPLGEQAGRGGPVVIAAAARNGENGWIALLHREARAAAAAP
jgi:hypothetical protein